MPINTTHNPETPTTTTVNASDEDLVYICAHCDRISTSHIGLVGHLRIHRTETGEPVPRAPTYTRRIRYHCSHCPCTSMHRMGLFARVPIHESGLDRSRDTRSTSCTPAMRSRTHTPSHRTPTITITEADTDAADFSCPHCPRIFTSRIGLIGQLRIHRTETGEPVTGAPTYNFCIRLHCPHCTRTSTKTRGRQPPAAPHLTHQHLPTHQHYPPQAPVSAAPVPLFSVSVSSFDGRDNR
nr:unnamed protein product [Spirometra erinaceieuropaei]